MTNFVGLPLELVNEVLRYLETQQLLQVSAVCNALHHRASLLLYRDIRLEKPRSLVLCLRVLAQCSSLASHVRTLSLFWADRITHPTRNILVLLHKALVNVILLQSLNIDIGASTSSLWVFHSCTFTLKSFTSTFSCDSRLARFLESQPGITALNIYGTSVGGGLIIQDDDHTPALASSEEVAFNLSPSALPTLKQFRVLHAGPLLIALVMQGRPVTQVSIPLYANSAMATLDALKGSTESLTRLNAICLDYKGPKYLLKEIVERFPKLEGLHMVFLMAEANRALLDDATELLAGFSNLQCITVMASKNSVTYDSDIPAKWYQVCPTLRTIILPHGRIWAHHNAVVKRKTVGSEEERELDKEGGQAPAKYKGKWTCLEEEDDRPIAVTTADVQRVISSVRTALS